MSDDQPKKPQYRAQCQRGPRPCPWVSCRYHLFEECGSKDPDEMKETCVLDIADKGGVTLDDIGQIFGLTRERVRQLEAGALVKIRKRVRVHHLDFEDPPEEPLEEAA